MPSDRGSILFGALMICLVSVGCQRSTDDRNARLEDILHECRKSERLNELRAIFVLTEEGCLPCTKAFAVILDHHLDDPKCLFWVTAMGTGLDISPYRSSEKRVVWDYDDHMRRSGILVGSGAILLDKGRIDTIVQIGNARTMAGSLAYLSDRLQLGRSDTLRGEMPL